MTNTKKWSVLYHKNCADGFCAAWIASKNLPLDTEFHAMSYGDELPETLAPNILILDFSLPRGTLEALNAAAASIQVLDHHKTAQKDLEGLSYCEFDMSRCGAMMTWDYFNPNREAPWVVKYVQDRDLWKWELQYSKPINTYLGSIEFDFEVWDEVNRAGAGVAANSGFSMLDYKNTLVERIVNNAREVVIDNYKVWCVNTPVLQSEVAGELAKRSKFGLAFFEVGDNTWQYSIRVAADVDFDAGVFAKKFGGGGHPKAAGFKTVDLVHWSEI